MRAAVAERFPLIAAAAKRRGHGVLLLVLSAEPVDFAVVGGVHVLDHVADPVTVNRVAKANLSGDFIAFGHGDLAHVIADAGDAGGEGVVSRGGGAGPDTHRLQNVVVLPVADDHLAGEAQPCADEPEFTAAVGRLVRVHEIHVDGRPGNFAIELRMQVEERLLQQFEPGDPHLRGREGVHPGDEADAVGRRVGGENDVADLFRRRQHGFEDDPHWNLRRGVERGDDLLRMPRDLAEGFVAVEILAPRDEPDFKLIQVDGRHGS